MMLHEIEPKLEKIIEYYRNWCVYEMTDLREKLTEEELKLLMIVCVTKYKHDEYNDTVDANFNFYIKVLKELKSDMFEVKKVQEEVSTSEIIPDIYTKVEIRNIKLGKVLDKEK